MSKILVKAKPSLIQSVGGSGGGGPQINLPLGGDKPSFREWGQLARKPGVEREDRLFGQKLWAKHGNNNLKSIGFF